MTNDLRIADAPLLVDVSGEEKLPTGGYGNYSTTINQIADFTQLKWKLATEGYVNNEISVVTNKLNNHTQDKTNPHRVTKEQVGLGEVDNTADLDKPVSAYQQSAIDEKIAKANIVDNLTTNEATKVLSAKQGKVLQDTKANKTDVYTKSEILTLEREDKYIITENGRTQREKNKELHSILDYHPNNNEISTKYLNLESFYQDYPQLRSTVLTLKASFFDVALELYKLDYKTLRIPKGTYNMNMLHRIQGYCLDCDDSVVFDLTNLQDTYALRARGTFGSEVNVTNVSVNILTVASSTGLVEGDWLLLKSETRCDNPTDAGEDWCLGAPTLGAPAVYFGEPVQIKSIVSETQIEVTRGLVFPKYTKTVNSRVATIKKMNFVTAKILGYPKLIMPNKYVAVTDFYLNHGSVFNLNLEATKSAGIGFMATYCMDCEANGTAKRPPSWTLDGEDHSRFNSWKSISGWFNEFKFAEYNGSQGVDQTYSDIPSIQEVFTVSAVNPTEQGMTTHGMSYGSTYNVIVVNANNEGFMNRARFSTVNATVIGNGNATASNNTANKGVLLCDWGMTDVVLNVNIVNCAQAIRFNKSYNSVGSGPKEVNLEINGQVRNCDYVYWFSSKFETELSARSSMRLNVNSTNIKSLVYVQETGWHCGLVSGSHTVNKDTDLSRLIYQGDSTFGWAVRNFKAVGYPSTMTAIHTPSGTPTNGLKHLNVDWDTCEFIGDGATIGTRAFDIVATTTIATLFTQANLSNYSKFRLVANANANRILTLSTTSLIPTNKELTIYCDNLTVALNVESGVNVIGTIPDGSKTVKIFRLAVDVFCVSGIA